MSQRKSGFLLHAVAVISSSCLAATQSPEADAKLGGSVAAYPSQRYVMLFLVTLFLELACWGALNASPLPSPIPDGSHCNGNVHSSAIGLQGELYVGGDFSVCGDVSANNVALYKNGQWRSLGMGNANGVDDQVSALAVAPDGTLYASGYFTTAGGQLAFHIAHWNGSAWLSLGDGMNNPVVALAVAPNGTLYAGGWFTSAGGQPANFVARWDGIGWSALGTGTDNPVYALAVTPNGTLYVGGNFGAAGGQTGYSIAQWSGNTWSLPSDLNNRVYGWVNALTVSPDGTLYAGGAFNIKTPEGDSLHGIGKWNGTSWSSLRSTLDGGTISGQVHSLALAPNGTLYAGGYFITDTQEGESKNIARWDGTAWSPLGAGTNDLVNTVAVAPNGTLYAGGRFTMTDGQQTTFIARWNGSHWSALDMVFQNAFE